jgi:hypothetical protein
LETGSGLKRAARESAVMVRVSDPYRFENPGHPARGLDSEYAVPVNGFNC